MSVLFMANRHSHVCGEDETQSRLWRRRPFSRSGISKRQRFELPVVTHACCKMTVFRAKKKFKDIYIYTANPEPEPCAAMRVRVW